MQTAVFQEVTEFVIGHSDQMLLHILAMYLDQTVKITIKNAPFICSITILMGERNFE